MATVRRFVFDTLELDQLAQLQAVCSQMLEALEPEQKMTDRAR